MVPNWSRQVGSGVRLHRRATAVPAVRKTAVRRACRVRCGAGTIGATHNAEAGGGRQFGANRRTDFSHENGAAGDFTTSRRICGSSERLSTERNRPAASRLAEERAFLRDAGVHDGAVPGLKWHDPRRRPDLLGAVAVDRSHGRGAQHPSTVEALYGGRVVCTMPRLRGAADHGTSLRAWSTPGAFARYRFREELFPSLRAASVGRTASGPTSSMCGCCIWRRRPASGRSRRRLALDSPLAPRATTPASRPRCSRRSRPFPWCTSPGRTCRTTTRC